MQKSNRDILTWPGGELDFSGGCLVMGILNVTPDSFSDGGDYYDLGRAAERAVIMAGLGAAIIDVGAESTRPGAEAVSADIQIERAVPLIETVADKTGAVISIDTRNSRVAKAAIEAGAGMINDVSAGSDEGMIELAAEKCVPIVLMHMQGQPGTMQYEPRYDDVVGDVLGYLLARAAAAESRGVKRETIFIDPGIGFGKTIEHNIKLLRNIDRFVKSGYRVLLGTSRKRFIGQITGRSRPKDRIFGTAATVAMAAAAGVSIVRVHDVAEMVDVVKVVGRVYQSE